MMRYLSMLNFPGWHCIFQRLLPGNGAQRASNRSDIADIVEVAAVAIHPNGPTEQGLEPRALLTPSRALQYPKRDLVHLASVFRAVNSLTGRVLMRIVFTVIIWLCSTVLPHADEAQVKLPVIGWLSPSTTQAYQQAGLGNPGPQLLRESLAKVGLIDGKNVRLEMRLAEGRLERLPGLAEALVRDGVTVILAFGEPAGQAAQSATETLPIVCVADDLIASGLAASLAKPGTNMTGVSILATELDAKKIELLKELLPDAKRLGVVNDPSTSGQERSHKIAQTARDLGVQIQTIDVHGPDDLEPAFKALRTGRAEGVNIVSSAMLTSFRRRLGELSLSAKIPAICQWRNMVEAGCLASYGITTEELYSLSADQIAKLLKGAKPADLPVQQPTKFELIISLKSAKALGVVIPSSFLLRADEVFE
jgi:putative tryptophan/tyrosine transport system substrate-binding protein